MSDAVAPLGIVDAIGPAGEKKAEVPAWQLVLRALLATYLLGAVTTLAVMVQVQTGIPVLGSVVFPIGLTLVVLVGLELVTGAFGVVPMAVLDGYEHAVVNFFVIPSGMMLGAPIGIDDWWVWNQVPVLVGNFIGGLTLAALGLYFSHRTRPRRPEDDVGAEDRDAQTA